MVYKVIFAPTAIARLEDIVRYIAADDPATAKTFAMHLLERADLLSEFPELGSALLPAPFLLATSNREARGNPPRNLRPTYEARSDIEDSSRNFTS